jgi:hypothetical protein
MSRSHSIIVVTALFGTATTAMAASEGHNFTISNWIWVIFPVMVVLLLAFGLPRSMQKWSDQYAKRQEEHYQRVESALERIATSLERLEKKDKRDA